jgi:hypothetical protein
MCYVFFDAMPVTSTNLYPDCFHRNLAWEIDISGPCHMLTELTVVRLGVGLSDYNGCKSAVVLYRFGIFKEPK